MELPECKNCKWNKPSNVGEEFDHCRRPGQGNNYSTVARQFKHLCGERARHFEPRLIPPPPPPTFWQRLGDAIIERIKGSKKAKSAQPTFNPEKHTAGNWMGD